MPYRSTPSKKTSAYLAHFGVKGMHWGVWNEETRRRHMGGGKRAAKSDIPGSDKKRGLTDKQKTALKVAAGVAIVAGVAGVSYLALKKHGGVGKIAVEKVFANEGKQVVATTASGTVVHGGVKESVAESFKRANPTGDRNNCPFTSMTGILRQNFGIDCSAKACKGTTPDALDLARKCFPGCKTIPRRTGDGATAAVFGKSKADAERMLTKRIGENASGIVGFQWNALAGKPDGAGHVIAFSIKDGKASFYDFQTGYELTESTWRLINPSGLLQVARLDDVKPDLDILEKYVKFH